MSLDLEDVKKRARDAKVEMTSKELWRCSAFDVPSLVAEVETLRAQLAQVQREAEHVKKAAQDMLAMFGDIALGEKPSQEDFNAVAQDFNRAFGSDPGKGYLTPSECQARVDAAYESGLGEGMGNIHKRWDEELQARVDAAVRATWELVGRALWDARALVNQLLEGGFHGKRVRLEDVRQLLSGAIDSLRARAAAAETSTNYSKET